MSQIKDMVKDKKKVQFQYYLDHNLWYKTECGFEFPVPISDTGNGIFLAEDKAILFMRYIRKELESRQQLIEKAKLLKDGIEFSETQE